MLGRKELVVLANLSLIMAAEKDEPISHVRGWINIITPITVEMLYSGMIHGYVLPSPLCDRGLDWDLASGIGPRVGILTLALA